MTVGLFLIGRQFGRCSQWESQGSGRLGQLLTLPPQTGSMESQMLVLRFYFPLLIQMQNLSPFRVFLLNSLLPV